MANIVEPAGKSKIRLYHFTLPCRLPGIFKTGALVPDATSPHEFMTGGVPAVWLTSGSNEIDRATIRHSAGAVA